MSNDDIVATLVIRIAIVVAVISLRFLGVLGDEERSDTYSSVNVDG